MAHTLTITPDDDTLLWVVFIDRRPVEGYNRELKAFLNLQSGTHRLVLDARGAGCTVKLTIDGGAVLVDPSGGWPLTLTVPKTKTLSHVVAEFTT